MKKISYAVLLMCVAAMPANAANSRRIFMAEVARGADVVGAERNVGTPDSAPGELGLDVYQSYGVADSPLVRVYVPTDMYLRGGAGFNLGFATEKVKIDGETYRSAGSYTTEIGLGWNMSSYVRTEIDFQTHTFMFSHIDDQANYQMLNGMLYFDLARRYVQHGDITRMRHFVPFMGIGAGFGHYEFEGPGGADGFVIAAPRAEFGFNFMLTDLIGIDVAYQYQMMIGNGFGWNVSRGGVDDVSNVVASFRVNF